MRSVRHIQIIRNADLPSAFRAMKVVMCVEKAVLIIFMLFLVGFKKDLDWKHCVIEDVLDIDVFKRESAWMDMRGTMVGDLKRDE